jgi:alanyl-tRNA synthetase
MTHKLYLDHAYDTAFEAKIVSSKPLEDTRHELVLDRTLFYPESGGQLADHGTLGDAAVTDVQEQDNDTVRHIVYGESPATGKIHGTINWKRRFDHMQQHTGQHVLSRAFIETDGLHTVSFHMGEESCTIDLEGDAPDGAAIRRAEDLANGIIEENRPIDITTLPIEALDTTDLRRKVPEGVREARIVSVRDFDRIPCCGTHVRSTGELGMVKVLKTEKVKSFQRVFFKVGARAMADYRDKHATVQEIANRLTTAPSDVSARVATLIDESQASAKKTKALVQRLAALESERLLSAVESGGRRIVIHRESDPILARALASQLQNAPGVVAIIASDDGSVVCTTSRDLSLDLAAPASALARELGGSGGGKGGFAQLKVEPGQINAFLERMGAHVRVAS